MLCYHLKCAGVGTNPDPEQLTRSSSQEDNTSTPLCHHITEQTLNKGALLSKSNIDHHFLNCPIRRQCFDFAIYEQKFHSDTHIGSCSEIYLRIKNENDYHSIFPDLIKLEENQSGFLFDFLLLELLESSYTKLNKGTLYFINLSADSLLPNVINTTILRLNKIKSHNIDFVVEISERINKEKRECIFNSLSLLRKNNIKIAIDDFDKEGFTLSELVQIKPDFVKLDRSFIVNTNADLLKYISNTIKRNMDVKIISEGIDSSTLNNKAIYADTDIFQGFLYDKPKMLIRI